ncbi:hypothetical protein Q31b_49270 [Novipirellula aureliae]|uniref:Uncharacterized protein n=1 Tax=Novipirellula aureliae TaxID=2527966 RepID=A0A5C6DNW0_9BACT|nr:hypothetical protein Q31b_49270 [Novipirellula aureliae]
MKYCQWMTKGKQATVQLGSECAPRLSWFTSGRQILARTTGVDPGNPLSDPLH